jgi:hypothetical protein
MVRKKWSQDVTEQSDALDLEEGVFTKDDPKEVALSLRTSCARYSGAKPRTIEASRQAPYRSHARSGGRMRMAQARRVVTGHDADGKSVKLSDGIPAQGHPMQGEAIGADFIELWSTPEAVPTLTSQPDGEPTARPFAIMPATGHLMRIIEIYPPSMGGKRTVMHRTRTLDYAVVIEGEVVLILDDGETVLGPGSVVVQRGTDHAWENRSDKITKMAFFHLAAEFSEELLAKLPQPLVLME